MIDTSDDQTDQQLHALLRAASPHVTEDSGRVRRMLREVAQGHSNSRSRPTRRFKIAAAVTAPLFLLGSATAAYAAAGGWSWYWDASKSNGGASQTESWLPGAQIPDARVIYSLPGGGSCELRMWGFNVTPQPDAPDDILFDPRAADLAREFAASADIATLMDVQSVIEENRSDANWGPNDNGEPEPFGYGTDRYNEDVEYHSAAQEAINDVITGHLESIGVPSNGLGWEGQEVCAGVDE
ncbi:hypothetical protein [Microbacterium trichothecenolyticum]|uniref:Uncharacterized protein n=1 Tax=Microbacterium trichothecenolyticum TaxID=69370 RepID=A0ABU0TY72_MICTR|nr:hypothetical protein [Microbacterium trichothecenolyticum]MDQ1124610.1 hypothetical protein [Microbacterium trichothecenolyticum]